MEKLDQYNKENSIKNTNFLTNFKLLLIFQNKYTILFKKMLYLNLPLYLLYNDIKFK